MTADTRRWLIFVALCALLLLSLPAKYGRAESRSPDRPESPRVVVRPERLPGCHGRVEIAEHALPASSAWYLFAVTDGSAGFWRAITNAQAL